MVGALILGALSGCNRGGDFQVDDHGYDTSRCPTGDDANSCNGASEFVVVANPGALEYVVIWRGLYQPTFPRTALYARRFDARSGEPRGNSVRLFEAGEAPRFLAVANPVTKGYVIASQEHRGEGAQAQPLEVRRFTSTLEAESGARRLGNWQLGDLIALPNGRVAVVGAENLQLPGERELPLPDVTLRIELLDASGSTVGVVRRHGRHGERTSSLPRAAFDASTGRLLIAWTPATLDRLASHFRFESVPLRIEQPGAQAGEASEPTSLAQSPPDLTCNAARGDCVLIYPREGTLPHVPDWRGRLIDSRGRPVSSSFRIARDSRGLVGVVGIGRRYSVSWYEGNIHDGRRGTVADTWIAQHGRVQQSTRHNLAGPAGIATLPPIGNRLIVWQQPAEHNSYTLRGKLLP